MRHVETALLKFAEQNNTLGNGQFITIDNITDVKGVAPIVKFQIQSDPISEVGVNGCQIDDIILYAKCLLESLNNTFQCQENEMSIKHLSEALYWQERRRKDRLQRQVEGTNKK